MNETRSVFRLIQFGNMQSSMRRQASLVMHLFHTSALTFQIPFCNLADNVIMDMECFLMAPVFRGFQRNKFQMLERIHIT